MTDSTEVRNMPRAGGKTKERTVGVLQEIVRKVWGYDEFRPLQGAKPLKRCWRLLHSVVVSTGGGKSLCFQAPVLATPGTAIVVSPLIALMNDQVDGLVEAGVAAAYVNSTLTPDERRRICPADDATRAVGLNCCTFRPIRLTTSRTLDFLATIGPSFFAIDERTASANGGHDFRPEYRMLSLLKERFPDTAADCWTRPLLRNVLRCDIARELHLVDPAVHVGSFYCSNSCLSRRTPHGPLGRIRAVVDRHPGESGVIY